MSLIKPHEWGSHDGELTVLYWSNSGSGTNLQVSGAQTEDLDPEPWRRRRRRVSRTRGRVRRGRLHLPPHRRRRRCWCRHRTPATTGQSCNTTGIGNLFSTSSTRGQGEKIPSTYVRPRLTLTKTGTGAAVVVSIGLFITRAQNLT